MMIFKFLLVLCTLLLSAPLVAQMEFTTPHGLHVTVIGWSSAGLFAYTFHTQSPFKEQYDHGFVIVNLREDMPLVHIEETSSKPLKLSPNAQVLTKKWLKHYAIKEAQGQLRILPFTYQTRTFNLLLEESSTSTLSLIMTQDKKNKTVTANLPIGTQLLGVVQSPHEERVAIILETPSGESYQALVVVGSHLNLGFS
jgi:hypothetical protein